MVLSIPPSALSLQSLGELDSDPADVVPDLLVKGAPAIHFTVSVHEPEAAYVEGAPVAICVGFGKGEGLAYIPEATVVGGEGPEEAMDARDLSQAIVLALEVGDTSAKVLLWVAEALHTNFGGGGRHELEKAHRTGWGGDVRIPSTLRSHLALNPHRAFGEIWPQLSHELADLRAPVLGLGH
jgi:hypothetical protein